MTTKTTPKLTIVKNYLPTRTCPHCGKKFVAKKQNHYTCSWACYQAYNAQLEAIANQPYKGHPF